MKRTITVKGTGKVTLKPDLTEVTMTLRCLDPDYDRAMGGASRMLDALRASLAEVGFGEDELKTSDLNVRTEYEGRSDAHGNYKNVFVGYACVLGLKLEFGFDTALLSRVLGAISKCVAEPELSVRFTVRDKDAAGDALLANAAENALRKAKVLADASGVGLGQLVSVIYSFADLDMYSPTNYRVEAKCMAMDCAGGMSIVPDDVKLEDTVTFVWDMA